MRLGPQGILPAESGVPVLDMGYEYWPQALEACLRRAWSITGGRVPLLVTENGIGTGDDLQRILPPRYVSEIQIHLGSRVEAAVAEFERALKPEEGSPNGPGGVGLQTWAPPAPPLTMPAAFPDEIEVQVRDMLDDARLVAVVELVSPGNKDRDGARHGFAARRRGCRRTVRSWAGW